MNADTLLTAAIALGMLASVSCSRAGSESGPRDRAQPATTAPASKPAALGFTVKDIDGRAVDLDEKYAGKVVLIVNVASKCGFTPQYTGLQALHEKYASRGLAVVGFPCNQFGGQEPGTNEEIQQFCTDTFDVTFDLMDKVDVNGDNASEVYAYLTSDATGLKDSGPVKWNFEKFLISRDGKVLARYRSRVTPEQIAADIETALKQ